MRPWWTLRIRRVFGLAVGAVCVSLASAAIAAEQAGNAYLLHSNTCTTQWSDAAEPIKQCFSIKEQETVRAVLSDGSLLVTYRTLDMQFTQGGSSPLFANWQSTLDVELEVRFDPIGRAVAVENFDAIKAATKKYIKGLTPSSPADVPTDQEKRTALMVALITAHVFDTLLTESFLLAGHQRRAVFAATHMRDGEEAEEEVFPFGLPVPATRTTKANGKTLILTRTVSDERLLDAWMESVLTNVSRAFGREITPEKLRELKDGARERGDFDNQSLEYKDQTIVTLGNGRKRVTRLMESTVTMTGESRVLTETTLRRRPIKR